MNATNTINVACPVWCDEADNHDPWTSSEDGLTITRGHGGRIGYVDGAPVGVYVMTDDHLRIDPKTSTMTLETVPAWIHMDTPPSATLTPDQARQLAALLLRAAEVAEGRTPDNETGAAG